MICRDCSRSPAAYIKFHHNVGMLFAGRIEGTHSHLCRDCVGLAFLHHQLRNVIFGGPGPNGARSPTVGASLGASQGEFTAGADWPRKTAGCRRCQHPVMGGELCCSIARYDIVSSGSQPVSIPSCWPTSTISSATMPIMSGVVAAVASRSSRGWFWLWSIKRSRTSSRLRSRS